MTNAKVAAEVRRPGGAACTAFAESKPAIPAADIITPRRVSKDRNLCNARAKRILAESDVTPSASPISARLMFWK